MRAIDRRLSPSTLSTGRSGVRTPSYDRDSLSTGIVHLGLGAFARAHVAYYTDLAPDLIDGAWGIIGATQRSRAVVDQLEPQDGLYTVLFAGEREGVRAHVVGAVRQVIEARADGADLRAALASPRTRIVSLTVTENGYRADIAARTLRCGDAQMQADLGDPVPHRTVVGQLVAGFADRARAGASGTTVLCCDNVLRGGELVHALCDEFLRLWQSPRAGEVAAWMAGAVRFPNTLVDRIVPATTDADRERCARLLGVRDEAMVVAEPFGMWIIENDFAAGHPAWPAPDVRLVDDIAPWSDLKLRLLNGSHSILAYLGLLDGVESIGDAVTHSHLAALLDRFLDEASRSLSAVPTGLDLDNYRASIVARFRNPALTHRLQQIGMDGSQKLPARIVATAEDLLRRGERALVCALAVAAWIRFLEVLAAAGKRPDDPLADELVRRVSGQAPSRRTVEQMLTLAPVFGSELRQSADFVNDTTAWLDALRRCSVTEVLERA